MAFDEPKEGNPLIAAQAELTVCAAAMLVRGFWEACPKIPDESHFEDEDLGALWEAILDARKRGDGRGAPSRHQVVRSLREMGWEEKRCFEAIARAKLELLTVPEASDAVAYLFERKLRMQVQTLCMETAKALTTTSSTLATVQAHERAIARLASGVDEGDAWKTSADVAQDDHADFCSTGIGDLDAKIGGFPIGSLSVIAARPGMGKSALMATVAHNAADAGEGVGINSLEMPGKQLLVRMACDAAWTPTALNNGRTLNPYYEDVMRGRMGQANRERYEKAEADIQRLPLLWDDRQGLSIETIRLGARRLATRMDRMGKPLRLLCVDHLGHVRPSNPRMSKHEAFTEVTCELMTLAKELGVAVLLLAQLNREVEKRPDKRPVVSDLRESGSIEENAHTILLLYRQAHYDQEARDRGEAVDTDRAEADRFRLEVHIGKNRGGSRKRVDLFCDIGANAIRNWTNDDLVRSRTRNDELFE